MPEFLVHGLWIRGSGLHLWIEQVEGHKILVPSKVPQGGLPPRIRALLDNNAFRHRVRALLYTPKGKRRELVIPTASFGPRETLEFLDALPHDAAVAPDLRWIQHLYQGLQRFVRAGRIVIKLVYEEGSWWPQWQLTSGLHEQEWVSTMAAAVPGILTVNNPNLMEDITRVLPHWIASKNLEGYAEEKVLRHEFTYALLHSEPLQRIGDQLISRFIQWRDSISAVDLQLVIIVHEPDDSDEDPLDDELDDTQAPEDPQWKIEFQVRSGVDSPREIVEEHLDSTIMEKLRIMRDRAVQQAPLLHTDEWSIHLTTPQLQEFLAVQVPRLKAKGFPVLLPKGWSTAQATAHLDTEVDTAMPSHFGIEQLVDYSWRVSVGDVELTDTEMNQLIQSKAGLIKLRGNWVLADSESLHRVNRYISDVAAASKKHLTAQLETYLHDRDEALRAKDVDKLAVLDSEIERLRHSLSSGSSGEVSLAELRKLALEAATRHEEPLPVEGDAWVTSLLTGSEGMPAPQPVTIPSTVHATLRQYQQRGVDWLYWMSERGLGAVLADDMGLGKTLQLLSLLAVEKEAVSRDADSDTTRDVARKEPQRLAPTLVVAPTSVVLNWKREAARFVPSFRVMVHHGNQRRSGDAFRTEALTSDVVVTSYGVVQRDAALLREIQWNHVVLDEAQKIKNTATSTARAVRSLKSRHRIALTGTPVENRLSEMRSILDFVNPGVLGSATFFKHHFAVAIERDHDEVMTQQLRKLTAPFILRRLKSDPKIIDDLPDKREVSLMVHLTPEQAALYKSAVDDLQYRLETAEGINRRGVVLGALTRLKQICNHPAHFLGDGSPILLEGRHRSGKVEKLIELIDSALNTRRNVLVFTQYKTFGSMLQGYLTEYLGQDIPFFHGGLTNNKREHMVSDFQSTAGAPVMIVSLRAGGFGLNLTAASVVIHMDRWWNPAVEDQATDRAYRIGQSSDVTVYKMVTAGTLEERIQEVLEGKVYLASAVIGAGQKWITELSADDLRELISYREE